MKLALIAIALLLAGCGSLTPTSVNPGITYVTNDIKAVTAAAGGDCSIQISAPGTGAIHTDCAPLDPTVTTVDQNKTTLESCFSDAATSQLGNRVSAAAQGLQVQLCAQQGKVVGPAPVVGRPLPNAVPPAK
jgi:hypothetical protein